MEERQGKQGKKKGRRKKAKNEQAQKARRRQARKRQVKDEAQRASRRSRGKHNGDMLNAATKRKDMPAPKENALRKEKTRSDNNGKINSPSGVGLRPPPTARNGPSCPLGAS